MRIPAAVDRLFERWYDRFIEERTLDEKSRPVEGGGQRHCGDLDAEACRHVPSNFFLYAASLVLTKLGDALASPKTTLTWVMSAVGAPAGLIALLVPIRESGSMLPQIVLGGWVRRLALRKWVWVVGSLLQALSIAAIAAAAAFTTGVTAGVSILIAVVAFSLSRSLSSIASKDVKGKTLPKGRRGRASGLAASLSGILTMGVALVFLGWRQEEPSPELFGALLAGAAGLWLLAAGLFSCIREQPGETADGSSLGETVDRLRLLAREPDFRRFVLTRAFFVSTALASPYYVLLARERSGGELSLLALFILAGGLASSLSSNYWGRWADRSSRRVLLTGAALASTVGILTFAAATWRSNWLDNPWTLVAAFFVVGVAHTGVRLGRKTYIVDMAEGNQRTDYVATANTVIGALLLLTGALGPLVGILGAEGMLLLLAVCGIVGIGIGWGLPEVQDG